MTAAKTQPANAEHAGQKNSADGGAKALPHERDERPEGSEEGVTGPREVILLAFRDLESGQEDTDRHDMRGVPPGKKRRK